LAFGSFIIWIVWFYIGGWLGEIFILVVFLIVMFGGYEILFLN